MTTDIFNGKLKPTTETLFKKWRQFLYDKVDFGTNESTIHGHRHCERVLFHALRLGEAIPGADNEKGLETLAIASVFHDSRRRNDYLDTGHGARAAAYYAEYVDKHPDMAPADRTAALIMRFHDRNDDDGKKAIGRTFADPTGAARATLLYNIFKDADALDRYRLGDNALDTRYLRFGESQKMTDFAKEAVTATTPAATLNAISKEVDRIMAAASRERKMLFIVDPQVDFITGTLPVPGAEKAMNELGIYIEKNVYNYHAIVISCDRHPLGHCSFKDFGGIWPQHCVADTVGAALWPAISASFLNCDLPPTIIHKGEDRDIDEYSVFANEENAKRITDIVERGHINTIEICGLAGDICVFNTLRDAVKHLPGIELRVLLKYCAFVNTPDELYLFTENNKVTCVR